ncbi:glycogen synthase [Bacillus methanolicus PB1]|uniref:Glycogen synthase n=1 Tax=Bacillus methanolicus PB1 TaxID=997296 RepID=I3DYN9_BACMT|nr:glycogen synthase GlgA [Bacillus methanolicus]EIJ79360.1 glycogen synthase [Bacillus methanolicus PB1]
MKVLFIVSECVPFVKSGGLADVAGSLPKELKKLGTDVRVILPKYGTISEKWKNYLRKIAEFRVQVGWRNQYCGIEQLILDGATFYFVDNEYYFNRERLYGFFDDGERFAYLNRAVLESLAHIDFNPDILHCHDWHTGMIPFLLRAEYCHRKKYSQMKTVFTIHNLQFQGIFPKEILGDLLNLNEKYFNSDQLEFYGNVNFMKGALVASDKITTVSPTYMQEIQTPYFGERLDGLLRKRKEDLQGILNGIDERYYNPEKDPFIFARYHKNDISRKSENKKHIQDLFGLRKDVNTPIIAMITRLTKQKGLDLVKCVFHELMAENLQMIVLGTGEDEFENFFREMAYHYPEKFKVHIGFNEELAHQIYAGSDLFLMPSKFEPCGLGQLIAMKYGSIPIVRETGGLNDTVMSYRDDNGEGNGFSFSNFNAHDMLYTIKRALQFYQDENIWKKLVQRAMGLDYSWAQSAFKYNSLYAELISRSESHVY